MIFSRRTNWSNEDNRFNKLLKDLKRQKIPLIDLTETNPTRCGFNYPREIFHVLSVKENLSYNPRPFGLLAAREAVSRYYQGKGYSVDPDEVIMTASTSEAYDYLFRLLADRGDEALFPAPGYPLFSYLADLNDVIMKNYRINYRNGWGIDRDNLETRFNGKTKALVIVQPNNPTGSIVTSDEKTWLNRALEKYNSPVISDEVFSDYIFDEAHFESFVSDSSVLTFTMGGLSKSCGLPQMKVAWIVIKGPKDLVKEAKNRLEIICDTFLSVNTPSQTALGQWLKHGETIRDQIQKRIRENYDFLKRKIESGSRCGLLRSQGGWNAVIKLGAPEVDEEELVINLLRDKRVVVYPGYFFDFDDGQYIVLSLLSETGVFQEGIQRILNSLPI